MTPNDRSRHRLSSASSVDHQDPSTSSNQQQYEQHRIRAGSFGIGSNVERRQSTSANEEIDQISDRTHNRLNLNDNDERFAEPRPHINNVETNNDHMIEQSSLSSNNLERNVLCERSLYLRDDDDTAQPNNNNNNTTTTTTNTISADRVSVINKDSGSRKGLHCFPLIKLGKNRSKGGQHSVGRLEKRKRFKLTHFFTNLWWPFNGTNRIEDDGIVEGDTVDKMAFLPCKICNARLQPYSFTPGRFSLFQLDTITDKPLPRSGHRIVSTNQYIYSFGGFNPDAPREHSLAPLLQELWRFCKLTQTWTLLNTRGSPPRELVSHCQLLLSDRTLLVFGGSGFPFGSRSSNKLYTCDLVNLQWNLITPTNIDSEDLPNEGYGQGMVLDRENDCIYVCGGTNGYDYNLDVHRFDLISRKWTKLASTPSFIESRYRLELGLWNQKLFIIGGGTSNSSFPLDQIPVFDIETRTWSLEMSHAYVDPKLNSQNYPGPRYSHDCDQIDDSIYMVGGTNENNTIFNDLWRLHLPTLQWYKYGTHMTKPRYFHAVSISPEGELSTFGGVTTIQTKVRSNMIQQVWIKIPSLQTITKQAIELFLRRQMFHGRKHHLEQRSELNSQTNLKREDIINLLSKNGINPNIF